MRDKFVIALISAVATALTHEWLHASSVTENIPNLTGTTTAGIGSVSVGLSVAVVAGVLINHWYWSEEM